MVGSILMQTLWIVALVDLFALVVLVIFFVNARINLARQVRDTRFYLQLVAASKQATTSYQAAEAMGIDVETYARYCREKGAETPEARIERMTRLEEEKKHQEQRIMEEEAAWRAEQDRILEERRRAQEEETRRRRDRLKKFGIR